MPTLTSSNLPAVTDLADALAATLNAGAGAGRATIDGRAVAFSWTDGLPPWAGSVFNTVLCEGLTYKAVVITPSATPVTKVAKGAPKPNAATLVSSNGTLAKYSGLVEFQLEDALDSVGLGAAIEATLFGQAMQAFSLDIAAALATTTATISGADWGSAILAAIGAVPWADTLAISPADYAAIASPSNGFIASNADAIPVLFGLAVVLVPGMPSGTAYVLSSSALTLFESVLGPVALLDPYSGSATNTAKIVTDFFGAAQLTSPGSSIKVTVTP